MTLSRPVAVHSSLQMRIVLASILTALIAELIDTKVYQLWTRAEGEMAAMDAGVCLQFRLHSRGQPDLSHHSFSGDMGAEACSRWSGPTSSLKR